MLARAFVLTLLLVLPAKAAERLPLSIPFDFENTQIMLKVSINGSEPGWFIVDSGASGCIVDTATAHRLGIATYGQAQGSGAGHGPVNITFANDVTYAFGGITLAVPRSYVIDFSNQPALLGRRVDGVLGYEFFARYVVAFDFEAHVMTLYDPAAYTPPLGAAVVPVTIDRRTPYITIRTKVAGADPAEQRVQIDSGSGDAVDHDALARSPQRLEVMGGVGSGEEFRMVMGRGEWTEFGPFRLNAPTGATGGVQLVGLEVLRRFDITFDYTHSRIVLAPNSHFADAFVSDASGLNLRWTADMKRFVVHDVVSDSPAVEAGLHTGDEVISINGQPSASFTIAQVNTLLTKAGQTVELGVRHNGTARTVRLRLRKRL